MPLATIEFFFCRMVSIILVDLASQQFLLYLLYRRSIELKDVKSPISGGIEPITSVPYCTRRYHQKKNINVEFKDATVKLDSQVQGELTKIKLS